MSIDINKSARKLSGKAYGSQEKLSGHNGISEQSNQMEEKNNMRIVV